MYESATLGEVTPEPPGGGYSFCCNCTTD